MKYVSIVYSILLKLHLKITMLSWTLLSVQNCVRFGWGDAERVRHGPDLGEDSSQTLETSGLYRQQCLVGSASEDSSKGYAQIRPWSISP